MVDVACIFLLARAKQKRSTFNTKNSPVNLAICRLNMPLCLGQQIHEEEEDI